MSMQEVENNLRVFASWMIGLQEGRVVGSLILEGLRGARIMAEAGICDVESGFANSVASLCGVFIVRAKLAHHAGLCTKEQYETVRKVVAKSYQIGKDFPGALKYEAEAKEADVPEREFH